MAAIRGRALSREKQGSIALLLPDIRLGQPLYLYWIEAGELLISDLVKIHQHALTPEAARGLNPTEEDEEGPLPEKDVELSEFSDPQYYPQGIGRSDLWIDAAEWQRFEAERLAEEHRDIGKQQPMKADNKSAANFNAKEAAEKRHALSNRTKVWCIDSAGEALSKDPTLNFHDICDDLRTTLARRQREGEDVFVPKYQRTISDWLNAAEQRGELVIPEAARTRRLRKPSDTPA